MYQIEINIQKHVKITERIVTDTLPGSAVGKNGCLRLDQVLGRVLAVYIFNLSTARPKWRLDV